MSDSVQYLTNEEIKKFTNDLDENNNGSTDYWELERKLDQVHKEIAPKAEPHHLHHSARPDDARHEFLRSLIGTREDHQWNPIERRQKMRTTI
jgi:dual oxidase